MEGAKFIRGQNFTTGEKEILLALIEMHKGLLECKRTDTVTSKAKLEEWERVASEFNAMHGVGQRTGKQLRLWWENQKKRSRNRLADVKVQQSKTGGGTCSAKFSDWDERVADISGAKFQPLANVFDSDANYNCYVLKDDALAADSGMTLVEECISSLLNDSQCCTANVLPASIPSASASSPLPSSSFETVIPLPQNNFQQQQQKTTITSLPTAATSSLPIITTAPVASLSLSSSVNDCSCLKSSRNWANRKRPYLQQERKTAMSASAEASEKIVALSTAKLELVQLKLQLEKESRDRAVKEHELRMEIMKAEHQLKMEVLHAQLKSFTGEE